MSGLAATIAEKAELAVQQFSPHISAPLDYSRASLETVEVMLAEAATHIDELPEQQQEAICELLGSYILELGFREFGGQFQWLAQHNQPVLVVGEPKFHVAIATFNKVKGRIQGEPADNIPFFYSGFAEKASAQESGSHTLYI